MVLLMLLDLEFLAMHRILQAARNFQSISACILYQVCSCTVMNAGSINTNLTTSVINKMSVVATTMYKAGLDFKLHTGYSAETSGKLFAICDGKTGLWRIHKKHSECECYLHYGKIIMFTTHITYKVTKQATTM